MNKKELEYLDDFASADSRFVANREWLEEMDSMYRVGRPSLIWSEAVMLADTMLRTDVGKNIVFAKWGNGMSGRKLLAVRKMAVYILEHPAGESNNLDFAELESLKNTVKLQADGFGELGNKKYIIQDEDTECYGRMVADCVVMEYVKKKAIKSLVKSLIRYSLPLSTGFFTIMLSLISAYNNELNGFFDEEYYQVMDIINERNKRDLEMKEKLKNGVGVFSDEQAKSFGINRLWLDMMALTLREREKYGVNADDEDFAVGFLVALRNSGEFGYKRGYEDFFRMMSDLFQIDFDNNVKSRIKRYVQDNGDAFDNWPDNTDKRCIRKKIASDLVRMKEKQKERYGFKK